MASPRAEDFGELFDRHARSVLAFCYRRTADPHTAADLTAETRARIEENEGRKRRGRP